MLFPSFDNMHIYYFKVTICSLYIIYSKNLHAEKIYKEKTTNTI